jgi:predicted negative regulator of RcsB-dependent stress response
LSDYLTEEEQIALLKSWIKQYSMVILIGLTLSAVTITGWRWWQNRQRRILSHASAVYDEMLAARAQDKEIETAVQSEKLFSHYNHTVYATMAAFMAARDAVENADYKEAEKQLRWVMDNSKVAAFRQIARIRLARILANDERASESLTILNKVEDKSFAGLIDEVEGDALVALKKDKEAREKYKLALSEIPNAEITRPLLKMKYDNLATFNS